MSSQPCHKRFYTDNGPVGLVRKHGFKIKFAGENCGEKIFFLLRLSFVRCIFFITFHDNQTPANVEMIRYRTADITMVTGMVMIIAMRIWVPVDHFTFRGFSAAPTPSTDIVMICVDDTG